LGSAYSQIASVVAVGDLCPAASTWKTTMPRVRSP
jgi:hypothetical protein